MRILHVPSCYERETAPRGQSLRKSALQGSELVRTVGPCAQRRVALMPRARAFVIPVNSSVAIFEQSENITIAHFLLQASHDRDIKHSYLF